MPTRSPPVPSARLQLQPAETLVQKPQIFLGAEQTSPEGLAVMCAGPARADAPQLATSGGFRGAVCSKSRSPGDIGGFVLCVTRLGTARPSLLAEQPVPRCPLCLHCGCTSQPGATALSPALSPIPPSLRTSLPPLSARHRGLPALYSPSCFGPCGTRRRRVLGATQPPPPPEPGALAHPFLCLPQVGAGGDPAHSPHPRAAPGSRRPGLGAAPRAPRRRSWARLEGAR